MTGKNVEDTVIPLWNHKTAKAKASGSRKGRKLLARDLLRQLTGDDNQLRRGLKEHAVAEYAATEGARIVRTLRERGGLTQKQLAESLGVTQQRINYLEAGKAKQGPTLNTIVKIACICKQRVTFSIEDDPYEQDETNPRRVPQHLSFGRP